MKSLRDIEEHVILRRLSRFCHNRTHTACSLGISVRTLQRKIKKMKQRTFLKEEYK